MKKKRIPDVFHFTRAERNGAVVLLCLIGLFLLAPVLGRRAALKEQVDWQAVVRHLPVERQDGATQEAELFAFDPNTADEPTLRRLGFRPNVVKAILNYRQKGGVFRRKEDLSRIYTLRKEEYDRYAPFVAIGGGRPGPGKKPEPVAVERSFFDPNTASEEKLLQMGLPRQVARNIIRYRSKGGIFREKEDLLKIYGMEEAYYQDLASWIELPGRQEGPAPRPVAYAGAGEPPARMPLELVVVDINRSAEADWMQLRGIGEARARRIVQFREKLGGFVAVEQVAETFGLPDSVFQQIRGQLSCPPPVLRKININRASESDLAGHPYIRYKQAKAIIAYREQHGPFQNPEAIRQIHVLQDEAWLASILPYLATD